MATYYPVIITAAIFIALIFNAIFTGSSSHIPLYTLEAFICVGLMIILSFKDMEKVSWGLLLLVFIILIICYYFGVNSPPVNSPKSTPSVMSCSSPAFGPVSTISLPALPTTSAQVSGSPYTFTPITGCST